MSTSLWGRWIRAQRRLVSHSRECRKIVGRTPGPRGTPRPALRPQNQAATSIERPTGASAADEGVRPTIYADGRLWAQIAEEDDLD